MANKTKKVVKEVAEESADEQNVVQTNIEAGTKPVKKVSKRSKNLKVKDVEATAKYEPAPSKEIEWLGNKVHITPTIGLYNSMQFVRNVVSSCFTESEFLPEIKEFVIRENIVRFYTDISLPDDAEAAYIVLCDSNLIDCVLLQINPHQIQSIIEAVNEKISYLTNTRVAYVNRKISEVQEAVEKIGNQMSQVFSGVESEDMAKLIGALVETRFDERKLVDAYLEGTSAPHIEPDDKITQK